MADCKAAIILGEKSICENCLKSDVCKHKASIDKDPILEDVIERCEDFKDRTKFVELPCKVGDTVYFLCRDPKTYEWYICKKEVYSITVYDDSTHIYVSPICSFVEMEIGKRLFLTKEEAEKALAERGENK